MREFIPVSEPLLNGNEKKYLNKAIDSAWISSEGPFVKEFEDKFAQRMGRRYGIAVSNGTVALEVAAKAIGIQKDDEVIVPTFTIISCAQAIIKEGGKVIPIDCNLRDFNILVDEIESKITNRTKAIMPVHIYGLPNDMDKIMEIADKYNLKIIEDAAEMHGQTYNNKPCGSFGDISTFSFYANKIVTTGEGGMLVTNSKDLADKCRYYRNLCFEQERRFVHNELSSNYRITNLQAAVGLAQLERLDEFIDRKRAIGLKYNEFFKNNKFLNTPIHKTDFAANIYWVYPLVINENCNLTAKFVMKELGKHGIGTRPFFYPLHKQPILLNSGYVDDHLYLPNSEYIAEYGFYIPSSLTLSDDEINFIANKVNQIVG